MNSYVYHIYLAENEAFKWCNQRKTIRTYANNFCRTASNRQCRLCERERERKSANRKKDNQKETIKLKQNTSLKFTVHTRSTFTFFLTAYVYTQTQTHTQCTVHLCHVQHKCLSKDVSSLYCSETSENIRLACFFFVANQLQLRRILKVFPLPYIYNFACVCAICSRRSAKIE